MSDLVPNLVDLRGFLPKIESATAAHVFLDRLSRATTVKDAGENIDALVDEWFALPSE